MTNNRYFIYGLRVPYCRYFEWEKTRGKKTYFGKYSNIFCSFSNRDGAWVYIGKRISAINEDSPIQIPVLTETEELNIKFLIKEKFGFEGDFHYYYIIE